MKILLVCLGNICRSPLAEGILRNKAESMDLDLMVDSAGTSDWHIGEPNRVDEWNDKSCENDNTLYICEK